VEEGLVKFFLLVVMIVTGYCNGTGAPPYRGTTASGIPAMSFTMACPPEMEFGTVIVMDGQIFVCMDRGPAIEGNRLDKWFPICEEAMEWGRQEKSILILGSLK